MVEWWEGLNLIGRVGFCAAGVLVVLWLVVSFTAPTPRRAVLEWLGATAMYVALSMLFLNLVRRMHASDNTLGLVAFGFLLAVFACGGVVSLVNTLRAVSSGGAKGQASATN